MNANPAAAPGVALLAGELDMVVLANATAATVSAPPLFAPVLAPALERKPVISALLMHTRSLIDNALYITLRLGRAGGRGSATSVELFSHLSVQAAK